MQGGIVVKTRKQEIGNSNLVGKRIEFRRKELGMKQKELLIQLHTRGIDLNASGLSKLEGQIRKVSDYELISIAQILDVSVLWLLGLEE